LDFHERNLREWEATIKDIFKKFKNPTPHNTEWHGEGPIIEVLNALGKEQLSHMFFPTRGGQDLLGARPSVERDCIELLDGGCPTIVKPDKLTFHFFGEDNYEWAYFRLETRTLQPSGVYDDYDSDFYKEHPAEELTELSPGEYVDRSVWDAGYYGYDERGEKRLPKEARVVSRAFRGAFVFFAKASTYNRTSGTYDARHNKMSSEEFEKHIAEVIDYLAKKEAE
jgi:hypothetical protein